MLCLRLLKKLREKNVKNIFIDLFIFTHIFTISGAPHFFLWIWVTTGCHFLLTWRTSISISCKIVLLAIISSVCIYLEMSLFLLHFMKDSFAEYRIPGWQFFSFSTFTIPFHCLWCSLFLMKSQFFIIFFFVCDELFFSCCC